ncbi:hypothetical protein SEA_SHAM_178 [Streptomyces phage Sham]|nr:hypothetical protein SEA_SHAM_178 [Streptomyces phage Sham]
MSNRKPKPAGSGNYEICEKCRGVGEIITPKKYTGKRIFAPVKTINLVVRCKQCLGAGWTAR